MQQYKITGMSCAACAARVEKAVSVLPGVTECAVSLLTNSMGVSGDILPEAVIAAVTAAGYGASLLDGKGEKGIFSDTETPQILRRLLASLALLILLMYISMGFAMFGFPLPSFLAESPLLCGIFELLLAAAVLILNRRFFVGGIGAVLRGSPNMDTLVALGSSASFLWSVYVLAFRLPDGGAGLHDLYFESAAMILTLITVGKLLESRAKGKTTSALRGLLALSPKTAIVFADGKEKSVPVDEVKVGDLFAVYPGANIPVDGEILSGASAIDESMLTGESVPAEKTVGDAVSAGTANRSGYLVCRATRIGSDTALSQIIKTVSEAAATKAPIARLADKISAVFVPAVIAASLLTVGIWLLVGEEVGVALSHGIAVLVISCPCALGLATPVAVTVGSGVGARAGILYKTAASIEAAGRIETVILDKTGTVTKGVPEVTDLVPSPESNKTELLLAAFALEKKSEHPLSRAVVAYAALCEAEAEEVSGFAIVPGRGLRGARGGKLLRGGNRAYIEEFAEIPDTELKKAEALADGGKTPLFFAEESRFLGCIAVADAVKPDSREAIAELNDMGISVYLLTGDNPRTASAVASAVGIEAEKVMAGVLPDGKADAVRAACEKHKTAMVGDGINDAPALVSADLGIAIGAGTDVAIDSADAVLMNSRLSDVPAALRLGRATLRNIRENLFWAFLYNTVGIPIAAGALSFLGVNMSPMLGAAAMSLSSFCVVTNALRLNLLKLHPKTSEKEKKTVTITVKIEGMMCPHCEKRVKEALEALPGVLSALPSHEKKNAAVETDGSVSGDALKKAVTDAGYSFLGIEEETK